jgi:hypothetical protein
MVGRRKDDARRSPLPPRFFVSVASKGLSISISSLESTLARRPISVAFKRLTRIPKSFRDVTSGEGLEDIGTTCARW